MLSTLITTAQLGALSPGHYETLLWGSIGIVTVVVLGFALMWFRRRYHPDSMSGESQASSFSMQSIEEMRASGAISEDEFRLLRAKSLGLDAPATDNKNSTLSTPGDVDDATEDPAEEPG